MIRYSKPRRIHSLGTSLLFVCIGISLNPLSICASNQTEPIRELLDLWQANYASISTLSGTAEISYKQLVQEKVESGPLAAAEAVSAPRPLSFNSIITEESKLAWETGRINISFRWDKGKGARRIDYSQAEFLIDGVPPTTIHRRDSVRITDFERNIIYFPKRTLPFKDGKGGRDIREVGYAEISPLSDKDTESLIILSRSHPEAGIRYTGMWDSFDIRYYFSIFGKDFKQYLEFVESLIPKNTPEANTTVIRVPSSSEDRVELRSEYTSSSLGAKVETLYVFDFDQGGNCVLNTDKVGGVVTLSQNADFVVDAQSNLWVPRRSLRQVYHQNSGELIREWEVNFTSVSVNEDITSAVFSLEGSGVKPVDIIKDKFLDTTYPYE